MKVILLSDMLCALPIFLGIGLIIAQVAYFVKWLYSLYKKKQEAIYTARVITNVNMRMSPAYFGKIVKMIRKGSKVYVIYRVHPDWCKIISGFRTGYVLEQYLEKED